VGEKSRMSIKVSRRGMLQMAVAPALLARAQTADIAPTTSKVYPGPDTRREGHPQGQRSRAA
jgi:hypothetical protein